MWWGQGIEGCEKDFLIPQICLPDPHTHTHTHTHTHILLEFPQNYTPLPLSLGQPRELSLTVCHWAGGFPSLSLNFLISEMEMIKIVLPHGGSCVCVCELCSTLCDPMDCSLSGDSPCPWDSPVHVILQAREWGAISLSMGSSQLRDQT